MAEPEPEQFRAMKKEMRDKVLEKERRDRVRDGVSELPDLSFAADYADDGVYGGDYETVLRVLKEEMAVASEYGLRFNFSKMVVYPLAGDACTVDLSGFSALGIKVDRSGNLMFMKVPVVGSTTFVKEWADAKIEYIMKVFDGLRGLSRRHVALYLLKGAGNVCRVLYYLRAIPGDMIQGFVKQFDNELRSVLEDVVGLPLSDAQWAQAGLGVRCGGLGVKHAGDLADAAYIASRALAYEECKGLDRNHVWDDGSVRFGREEEEVVGEWLFGSTFRYDATVLECSHLHGAGPANIDRFKVLVGKAEKIRRPFWRRACESNR